MVKHFETLNGLVISLLGEVSHVKKTLTDLHIDFRKLKQHSEDQASELKAQAKVLCEMQKEQKALGIEQQELLKTLADHLVQAVTSLGAVNEKFQDLQTMGVESKKVTDDVMKEVKTLRAEVEASKEASTEPSKLTQIMAGLDDRIRSYADVTRQAQSTALQEHDRESKDQKTGALTCGGGKPVFVE
ncbi:hypothetical protein R1sor_018008 [Riccia sorocarpa]|uniref:Uncharacterized protein n=1 Tax=Riccia sorocarpa TaxID=122646 RepID=A0ABD3ICH0_9MARC